jgi:hypothetical protein
MANLMRTFRTFALLGSPSVQSIHDYCPFAMEDGGRLAVELVVRLSILVAFCRFPRIGDADSRPLRYDNYVRMQHFVRRTTYVPFGAFWVISDVVNSCNVFLLLFMAL